MLKHVQELFFHPIPVHESDGEFSFAWTGHTPGESFLEMYNLIDEVDNLVEFKDRLQSSVDKWISSPISMVMADRSGNIGYALLSCSPIRSNETPFMGS